MTSLRQNSLEHLPGTGHLDLSLRGSARGALSGGPYRRPGGIIQAAPRSLSMVRQDMVERGMKQSIARGTVE